MSRTKFSIYYLLPVLFLIAFVFHFSCIPYAAFYNDDQAWILITRHFIDSSVTAKIQMLLNANIISIASQISGHSSLAAALHAIPYSLFGTVKSVLALVVFCVSASGIILFLIGKRVNGYASAFIAWLIFLLLPSHTLDYYLRTWQLSYLPLAIAFSLFFFFRFREHNRSIDLNLCFAFFGLSVHFHPISFAFIIPALLLILADSEKISFRQWLIGSGLFSFFLIPFFYYQVELQNSKLVIFGTFFLFISHLFCRKIGKRNSQIAFTSFVVLAALASIAFGVAADFSALELLAKVIPLFQFSQDLVQARLGTLDLTAALQTVSLPLLFCLGLIHDIWRFKKLTHSQRDLLILCLATFAMAIAFTSVLLSISLHYALILSPFVILCISRSLAWMNLLANRYVAWAISAIVFLIVPTMGLSVATHHQNAQRSGLSYAGCASLDTKEQVTTEILRKDSKFNIVILRCVHKPHCSAQGGGWSPFFLEAISNHNKQIQPRSGLSKYYYIDQGGCDIPKAFEISSSNSPTEVRKFKFKEITYYESSQLIEEGTLINVASIEQQLKKLHYYRFR